MATKSTPGFDVAPGLRTMAESTMTQARQAFDGFMGAAQDAVGKLEERTTAARTGARAANEQIMSFAQQNIANSFDYAERLVKAQNISEIMQIHAEFAKSQMQVLAEQAKAMGQAAAQVGSAAATGRKLGK